MRVRDRNKFLRARLSKDYNQRELAGACGVVQNTIWLIEAGRTKEVNDELAVKLAKRLDLPLDELFETIEVAPAPTVTSRAHSPRVHRTRRRGTDPKREAV
jgi:transcriptional regulator with XRE-family HTH domain